MSACPDDDRLGAWLQGSLSPEAATEIEAHVDGCATCFRLVDEIARVYAPSRSEAATSPREPGATLAPHATFDRYVIEALVGVGGMGAVYRAKDSQLRRTVALKVLHATGDANRGRITREARLLARLCGAPHIVPIYDAGSADGRFFIVMEFVRGRTVDTWLQEQLRTPREIVAMYIGALRGVAEAHRCGVVHRDLKPSNILVDEEDRARVVDFGLARSESGDDSLPVGAAPSGDDMLTVTGAVVGTPRYMAPEQHLRAGVDERTDQFALCVCLYEALYRQHPFEGDDYDALRDNVVAGNVRPPPARRGVSRTLRDAILRGLRAEPTRRWPSLAALERALLRARRPWIPLAVAGVAATAVAAIASGSAARTDPACTDAGVSDVWNDQAAANIRGALADSGTGFADETATIVNGRIDGWVARWLQTRTRLCQDPSAAAARRCLDRGHAALEALVNTLGSSADADATRLAIGTVSALPDPESCELATEPADDGRQEERAELEVGLTRVTMLRSAHRMKEARELLHPLLQQARDLGGGAQLAEALRHHAWFLATDGAFEEAAQTYEEAYYEAHALGADAEAMRAALQLVFHLAHSLGRIDEAYAWADKARGLLPRLHGGYFPQKLDLQLASIAQEELHFDDAIALTEGVVEVYRNAPDVDPSRLGVALNNLALAHEGAGNLDTALELYDEALVVQTAALGKKHPEVASMHSNRANVLLRTGKVDEARRAHQRAEAMVIAAFGPDHPQLYFSTYGLALVEETAGRDEEAARYYRRAVEIRTAIQGREDSEVAHILYGLAGIAERAGDRDLAERYYLEGLGILERTRGADHPEVAITLVGMGVFYADGGDPAAARGYFERALSIQRARLPARHPDVAATLNNLAEVSAQLGEGEAAGAAAAEAKAIKADFRERWPQ